MQDCVAVCCIILVPPSIHSLEMARIRQFLPSPWGQGEEADLFVNHSLFKQPTSHLCVMYLPNSKPCFCKDYKRPLLAFNTPSSRQYATIILNEWWLLVFIIIIIIDSSVMRTTIKPPHSAKTITWPILAGWYRQLYKHRIKWVLWRMIVEKFII